VLGPAEVPPKRAWIYRHVQWLAQRQGAELAFPAVHPFNPLGLLRLAVATQAQGLPNRYVCETVFKHVWTGGADAADAARLQALTSALAPAREPGDDSVKAQLKAHSDEAIAQGVFGVPSFVVDGRVFWGLDALPMLRACLEGDTFFTDSEADRRWNTADATPSGIPLRTT
jgi:2-hydroxychromene-2-carboxylate isomerase